MSVSQALAIAAAGLVLAGDPWGGKLAVAAAHIEAITEQVEIAAELAVVEAGSRFHVTPDGGLMKRSFAVL